MIKIICLTGLLACSVASGSISVSSLVGDKDGFGIAGMDPVPADGTEIYGMGLTQDPGDPPFMDIWGLEQGGGAFGSPIVYSHDFAALPDTVLSASLVIQHAGMGDSRGPWDVAINGVSIGQIGPDNADSTSIIETFVVPMAATTIGLTNIVTLTYLDSVGEGFAINFSELTAVVPEPMTVSLLGLGGLSLLRRRKRKT